VKAAPVVAAITMALAGCATVSERGAFDEVAEAVESRIGQRVAWAGVTAEDAAVERAVAGLLSDELTADAAVQVALLNNRELQATYADLGLARAELVQAGLLRNPVFDAVFRFPVEEGGTADIDLGVAFEFLNILAIPLRRRVAEEEFEATKLRVTGGVIDLAARAQAAFHDVQARQQTLNLFETVERAQAASLAAAEALHVAGNVTDLDLARERLLHAQARLALSEAEEQVVDARERLNVLMGLWGDATGWRVAQRLPNPENDRLEPAALERRAIEASLDLAAARHDLLALGRAYNVTAATSVIPELELGGEAEREGEEGTWSAGPAFAVALPVFDFGQARRAAARAAIAGAQDRYRGLAVRIRAEARRLAAEVIKAREAALYYRGTILPLTQEIVGQSQLQYNAMQLGVFDLLAARREQIEAGRRYVEALRDYWNAKARLNQLLSGRLPAEAEPPDTVSITSAGTADDGGD
jgi:cobalt-zinc-cadmium efflux system outer membrane protein